MTDKENLCRAIAGFLAAVVIVSCLFTIWCSVGTPGLN